MSLHKGMGKDNSVSQKDETMNRSMSQISQILEQTKDYHIIQFQIDEVGDHTISVSLPDKCNFPVNKYKYSGVRFIMLRPKNDLDLTDGLIYIKGLYQHWERDYYIELPDCEPGKYMAYIEFDWHDCIGDDQRDFNVTTYGPG